MTPDEAIKIVKSQRGQPVFTPRVLNCRIQHERQHNLLDEVLVAEIERLRNIVVTTLLYRDETTIMFNCPRCDHPYKLNDIDSMDVWCCDECEITLHFSDTTFIEIFAQVQKRYAF